MTGAYTKSAFAGVVIILISRRVKSSLAHEYEFFFWDSQKTTIFYGSEGLF